MIRTLPAIAAAAALFAMPIAARAELPRGARAPAIASRGALAGKPFTFDLARALKRGPVVLYFYPKAFTQGCTLEAHAFAEAMPQFRSAGASVVGLSADDLPTLVRFSREECRDAFPVAQANAKTIAAYDVGFPADGKGAAMAKRVSYVIAPDGRIAMVHSDSDFRDHVKSTLAAVHRLTGR